MSKAMDNPSGRSGTCVLPKSGCIGRREWLQAAVGTTAWVALGDLFGDRVSAQDSSRQVPFRAYPRKRVAALNDLIVDQPIAFRYPVDEAWAASFLVKLGRRAGGGLGPDSDIVAFNTTCTHMGGDVSGSYNATHKVAGPCMEHLTTFDLTRHGMVVAGHASQELPQVVLEIDEQDIVAVGVIGLIYGCHRNLA